MVKLAIVATVAAALVAGSDAVDCVGNCLVRGSSEKMKAKMAAKDALWSAAIAERQAGRGPGTERLASGEIMPCIDGLAGDLFPCKNIDLLSRIPDVELGTTLDGSDIWGWEDPLTGHEYAIFTMMDRTAFIDVTDPVNPVPLVLLLSESDENSYWRDVKVFNNTAYIVADIVGDHGLQVFDLERLRAFVDNPPASLLTVEPDFLYTGLKEAHNIIINEDTGFAYASGGDTCAGGFHVLNLNNDRLLPEFMGCWSVDGYVHDAQCVTYDGPDTRYTGREICFCYDEDTLTIVDITDKTVNTSTSELDNVVILSNVSYPGYQYTHQGWLTDDSRFLLLNDEGNRFADNRTKTFIFNVDKITDPQLRDVYISPEAAIAHNLYNKKSLSYMSNYESGLRVASVLDIYSGGQLKEVAYFDTYPPERRRYVDFYGTWSSYIYFNSGNIILGTVEYGFFVVRLSGVTEEDLPVMEDPTTTDEPETTVEPEEAASFALPVALVCVGTVLIASMFFFTKRGKTASQEEEIGTLNPKASV